jgi:hypothetical protein
MRRNQNEYIEQSTLVQWCKLNEHKHPELKLLFAIPNGGHRHIAVAHKMKKEGVRSGVPDLFLPVARGKYHGLFVEMKAVGGRPSHNQAVWIKDLTQQGYMTIVCFNWIVAKEAVVKYLSLTSSERPAPPMLPARKEEPR